MGKEKSLVTVKLTPTSHLELDLTNGFVSWGSISGDSSCRTSSEREWRALTTGLRAVVN